jgi:DNA-binding CsgD family transcriptional regulator
MRSPALARSRRGLRRPEQEVRDFVVHVAERIDVNDESSRGHRGGRAATAAPCGARGVRRPLVDGLAAAARQELRAAGETSRRRAPDARDGLTPRELQIAELAARGLSNKEIGQRLYLSHRTVGSHLYRLYPKLGVSSGSELRDALEVTR